MLINVCPAARTRGRVKKLLNSPRLFPLLPRYLSPAARRYPRILAGIHGAKTARLCAVYVNNADEIFLFSLSRKVRRYPPRALSNISLLNTAD